MLNSKCIFCKIIFGNLPSNIIVQDEKAIAFLDAFPLTKGHTLVIPKMHFSKVQNMTEEYGSALFRLMLALVDPIEKAGTCELVDYCYSQWKGSRSGSRPRACSYYPSEGRRWGRTNSFDVYEKTSNFVNRYE